MIGYKVTLTSGEITNLQNIINKGNHSTQSFRIDNINDIKSEIEACE
ncbi:MAG: hypothetical protein MI739_04585 [Bacteroidales bacterium]|nr:hypothetical protein [Bacteroidales bacterium]